MAGRTPPDVEKKILALAGKGLSSAEIAERLRMSDRTVRRVIERAQTVETVQLPNIDDKRLTAAEVVKRMTYARDCCVVLAEASMSRLGANLSTGGQVRDVAQAMSQILRELRQVDSYYRLMTAAPKRPPKNQDDRERAYVTLLWTLAAAGNVPAARSLARAWGIEEIADRGGVVVTFDDADEGESEDDGEGVSAAEADARAATAAG